MRALVPLVHVAVLAATVLVLSRVLPGFKIKGKASAVVVAVVFSALNFAFGWALKLVLVVPAIFTLGLLFLFVPFIVNTVLLWLTDKLLKAFEIENVTSLLLSGAAITLVSGVLHLLLR